MKIFEIKTVTEDRKEVQDILCNKCGNSCRTAYNYEGLIEASVSGGYDSKLGDMVTLTFSICEDCLPALFDSFRIPPSASDQMCSNAVYWEKGKVHVVDADLDEDIQNG
jgi:hypothetical protein